MSRSKDPLALSPHWHVDYRIEAELPEDTVVGTRFLINLAFTIPALVALIFFGLFAQQWWDLTEKIGEAERFISQNKTEVSSFDDMWNKYTVESSKIEQAYLLVRSQLFVSEFIANIGRTRREQMFIDLIEWNETGIVLRGGVREKSEQATRTLGGYVAELGKDEKIKPYFQTIQLTAVDRGASGDTLRFEIKFTLKVLK
jgi:hypothetical protein